MASAAKTKAIKAVEAIFESFSSVNGVTPISLPIVYRLIAKASNFTGFDKHVMESLKIIDASPSGTVTFDLTIDESYANLNEVMHGGAAGVIFDMGTTTALGPLARPGYWDFLGGVTRSLNISYLRAIPVGTTVRIHSEVAQVGRTMSSQDGKHIYCTCEHHKVNVPTRPEHLKYKIEWDGLWESEKTKGPKL